MKTNATRLLERMGIPHALKDYQVDEDDLSAIKVAGQIGLPAGQVFKTLVAKGDVNGVVLAVVPGNAELDLKALARLSENRRMELVPVNNLRQLTGYIRGGVTALATKRDFAVYVDESVSRHSTIAVSAGVRGTQILPKPSDYLAATHGRVGQIARNSA